LLKTIISLKISPDHRIWKGVVDESGEGGLLNRKGGKTDTQREKITRAVLY
jgi:hypothetical protein